jgi:hypothetical protein
MYMDWEKVMFLLIERRNSVEERNFGKLPISSIWPAVIVTGEYSGVARLFSDDGESHTSVNVVKAIDSLLILIQARDKGAVGLFSTENVTRSLKRNLYVVMSQRLEKMARRSS